MKVRIIQDYNDTELKRKVTAGEELEVTEERGNILTGQNPSKVVVAEEIKLRVQEEEQPVKLNKRTKRSKKEE